jgi:hypothetical protein
MIIFKLKTEYFNFKIMFKMKYWTFYFLLLILYVGDFSIMKAYKYILTVLDWKKIF